MKLSLLGPYVTELLSEKDTKVSLGTEDLKTFALRTRFVVSLLIMLTSMLMSRWLGPFRMRSLKRKILYAAVGSVMLVVAFPAWGSAPFEKRQRPAATTVVTQR